MVRALFLLSLISAVVGVSLSTLASTPFVESESLYQPRALSDVFEIRLKTLSESIDTKLGTEISTGATLGSLTYERGFTDGFSSGVTAHFESADVAISNTEWQVSGWRDLDFFAKGRRVFFEGSTSVYGGRVLVSSNPKEFKDDSFDAESGGLDILLHLGHKWLLLNGTMGFKFEYTVFNDAKVWVQSGSHKKYTGGQTNELQFFMEYPLWLGWWGLTTYFQDTAKTKSKEGDVVSEYFGDRQFAGIRLAPVYQMTETLTVLGVVDYSTLLNDTLISSQVDNGSRFSASLGLRMSY